MRELFEEYGDVILQVIGAIVALAIPFDMIRPNGVLHQLIVELVNNAI